jgi:hypothetical protein
MYFPEINYSQKKFVKSRILMVFEEEISAIITWAMGSLKASFYSAISHLFRAVSS